MKQKNKTLQIKFRQLDTPPSPKEQESQSQEKRSETEGKRKTPASITIYHINISHYNLTPI